MANIEISTLTRNNDGNTYIIKDANAIPKTGSNQISGDLIPSTTNTVNLGTANYSFNLAYISWLAMTSSNISRTVDNDSLSLFGGSGWQKGAFIQLKGKDSTGNFSIESCDGTNTSTLLGTPSGTLTWNNKNVAMQEDVVPRSGGAVMTGISLGRADNTSRITLCGGVDNTKGGSITIYGKDQSTGDITLQCFDGGTLNAILRLHSDGTWSWTGQAIQYTSDQRLKQQISQIDDDLLTAWEDVEPVQFKYNDAVKEKSDNARLHTGYVVQQIDDACKSHNVDISKYGLYCHEEYPERTEEVTIENEDGTTSKETKVIEEASEHYSLRYTETLVVECAYLRRENTRLKTRLNSLESRLEQIEQSLK